MVQSLCDSVQRAASLLVMQGVVSAENSGRIISSLSNAVTLLSETQMAPAAVLASGIEASPHAPHASSRLDNPAHDSMFAYVWGAFCVRHAAWSRHVVLSSREPCLDTCVPRVQRHQSYPEASYLPPPLFFLSHVCCSV